LTPIPNARITSYGTQQDSDIVNTGAIICRAEATGWTLPATEPTLNLRGDLFLIGNI